MTNMGYVRFENTLRDVYDCINHLNDENLSVSESKARKHLLLMVARIAEDYAQEIIDLQAQEQEL